MSRWWRAEDTSIDHPKLLRLSDAMHRAWYTLMCIASANEGTLPPTDDIAVRLRVKPALVASWITELVAAKLFDKDGDTFRPHNWDKRQYKSDVTDPTAANRNKRYRDRKRNDRNATVTQIRPEAEQTTETEQSRADAGAFENDFLKRLSEVFGKPETELDRARVWLDKGYPPAMILETVREVLARGKDVGSLGYFDSILAERHANRPETPSERAAATVDMDKVAAFFKKTGVWSKYAGPEPGMGGCKCPPEILRKYEIMTPGMSGGSEALAGVGMGRKM